MPELPEVITIKRDLQKEIVGKTVTNIKILKEYAHKVNTNYFNNYVLKHTVDEIDNVAKLLTFKLSSGYYIATHLNMSGLILYNSKDPYAKIVFTFNTGDTLTYSDTRMFGYFEVWTPEKINEYKKGYGKTPLDAMLDFGEFEQKLTKKNIYIKLALLDQKLISGIGNIYANDSLYMSNIHPKRKTSEITSQEYKKLFENVKKILQEGIEHRGSTIDRYRDIYGKPGTQQNYFRVYGKTGQLCVTCNTPIQFEKVSERGTFFCAICQPLTNQLRLL